MTFRFDGEAVAAQPGQTIAAALLADGRRVLRHTGGTGAPRGIFCGIGACFDCLVVVNGQAGLRACLVEVDDGDEVRSA